MGLSGAVGAVGRKAAASEDVSPVVVSRTQAFSMVAARSVQPGAAWGPTPVAAKKVSRTRRPWVAPDSATEVDTFSAKAAALPHGVNLGSVRPTAPPEAPVERKASLHGSWPLAADCSRDRVDVVQ